MSNAQDNSFVIKHSKVLFLIPGYKLQTISLQMAWNPEVVKIKGQEF